MTALCCLILGAVLYESTGLITTAIRAPQTRVSTARGGGRRGDDPLWELPLLFDDEPQP